jgi:hypothetical protein
MGTSGDVWEVVWRGYWEIEKGERERERVGLKVLDEMRVLNERTRAMLVDAFRRMKV